MSSSSDWLRAAIAAEVDAHMAPAAQVFDVHSHTGADVDGSARSCDEQLADLARVGGRSVIFPLCVETGYPSENRRVIAECERDPDRLVPFARIDPGAGDASGEARRALGEGARGFKLHPRAESFRLDHPGVDAVAEVAAEASVPVLIHAGVGVGSFGEELAQLARRHRCPLILAHAGISDLGWLWREIDEYPDVYFDTAWWNPVDLLALFALIPPGRILWGSDAPYGEVELGLALTLRCARFAGLSDDAVALVAGGQTEALLAGEAPVDAGPAPGPSGHALSPDESRLLSWLMGSGGALLTGGDPELPVELTRVVAETWRPAAGGAARELVIELIDSLGSPPQDARSKLVLAIALAATPGLGLAEQGLGAGALRA